jgi:hypothetical protein
MFILFFKKLLRVDAFGPERLNSNQADKRVRTRERLIAGEKVGAGVRWQHRQVAAWADKKIHPASE